MADGEPSKPPAGEKENKEVKEEEETKAEESPSKTEDTKKEEESKEEKKEEKAEPEKEKSEDTKPEPEKEEDKKEPQDEGEKEEKEEKEEEEKEKDEKEKEKDAVEETDAAKEDSDKKEVEKPTEVAPTDKQSPGFKIGDWYCQSCGNHNFARRNQCMACQQYKMTHPVIAKSTYNYPTGRSPYGPRMPGKVGPREVGDWECPNCYNFNFARRSSCKWCFQSPTKYRSPPFPFQYPPHGQSFPHPSSGYYSGYGRQMGPYGGPSQYQWSPFDMMHQVPPQFQQYGSSSSYNMYQYPQGNRQWASQTDDPQSEWDCWVCGNLNFAKRSKCKSCETEREKALPRSGGGVPRPGDWFCMSCQNVNFSKRHECKICNSPRSTSSNELVLQRLRGSGQVPF
eukprot:TRINITY_DN10262_c0_g1_i3.p1 TRINITY_DN10262_c0_g1~~TRINITY_DN10262_c0_g1_i3.p1  ORF type:complete len:410 (+),score=87.36 TRINITY_DN10262_c0_g1_i3:45-1232(+)